jgi:hypothetical protein
VSDRFNEVKVYGDVKIVGFAASGSQPDNAETNRAAGEQETKGNDNE